MVDRQHLHNLLLPNPYSLTASRSSALFRFNLSLDALIADWQAVPAMAEVVKQAREML